ncbi:hypothetical protein [Intrasporangium flavum]|uniref:hypothetical protein n=1 Tax=Intrasporangium flavum TaxID=1428657 RepID=UPI00096F9FDC|nr:hypothetical protein [Intrasporangium flavum]
MVVVVIIAAALAGPQGFTMLFPARAEHPLGTGVPQAGVEEEDSRILPAVAQGKDPGAGSYAFLSTSPGSEEPVTYDPCRPIHYVIRSHGESPLADQLVHDAAAEVSQASGLRLVYDGTSGEAPRDDRAAFQPELYGDRWAPVLIAWSDPVETAHLAGRTAGVGGSVAWPDSHGRATYVTGMVRLDTPSLQEHLQDPGASEQVRAIIAHELAHVLGAAHVTDRHQLMYPENLGQTRLGAGDRYALARLGQGECAPGL